LQERLTLDQKGREPRRTAQALLVRHVGKGVGGEADHLKTSDVRSEEGIDGSSSAPDRAVGEQCGGEGIEVGAEVSDEGDNVGDNSSEVDLSVRSAKHS
jgi:hypothetical protein